MVVELRVGTSWGWELLGKTKEYAESLLGPDSPQEKGRLVHVWADAELPGAFGALRSPGSLLFRCL